MTKTLHKVTCLGFFLVLLSLLLVTSVHAITVGTFQVTTEGSQQKDAFVFKDYIAYDSQSDIWIYNLETKQDYPVIQKEGEQYITDFQGNLIVYQDIAPGQGNGDIRTYNVRNGKDALIIGELNSYSSGATNGDYVVYLDGGACGSLYAYRIRRAETQHIIDNVCTPRISDNIVYWSENAPGGPDIRGYDLRHKKFLDLVTEDGFQGPASMFGGKIVYIDSDGGGIGSYQAVKVKDIRRGEVTTIYEATASSINWPSISSKYVVWSEAPEIHVNSIKAANLRTGEVFELQPPGPHQNSHTITSIWKDTAAWMSWRTGNGDIYASVISR